MSIGYLLIEHFAVAVERQRHAELSADPLIVGGHPFERKPVYDASVEAVAAGVRPGLPLRQAEQLCPSAIFLPADLARYQEVNETLLATLERFSPAVVPDALGSAYFDSRGLERMLGVKDQRGVAERIADAVAQHLGLCPSIGLAPTRFAASVAARLRRGIVLAVADAAALLSDLPVEYLPGDAELYDRLRLLGIATIGQFMQLPPGELMEQFGPAGVAAYDLAWGRREMPLMPRPRPAALWQTQEFEPPLRDGTALAGALGRMSAMLAARLRERYQACQTVILRLVFGQGAAAVALDHAAQLKEPAVEAAAIAAAAVRLSERLCASAQGCDVNGYETDMQRINGSIIRLSAAYPLTPVPQKGREPGRLTLTLSTAVEREQDEAGLEIVAAELAVAGLIGQGGTQPGLFDAQRQRRAAVERAAAEVERRFGNRLKRAERAPATSAAIAPPFVLRDWSPP